MENNNIFNEEIRTELQIKYKAVQKLLDEDSNNDSESEPFKSKYAAMEILKNMQNTLFYSVNNSKQEENEVIAMLACVYLYQGIIAIDTEELNIGRDYLINCLEILNKNEVKSNTVLIFISALNQLGILCSKRDQTEEAKKYLKLAEKAFNNYKHLKKYNDICNMSSLFGIEDQKEPKATEIIENLHTLTLYYLAQIYGRLNDSNKSAVYCHMTLKRQLETTNFDNIDWALNAATLSQFFMGKGAFHQAKHHLAAATFILEKYKNNLKNTSLTIQTKDQHEIFESKWENFKHRSADISRCWAKYGILLMSNSRERLISNSENVEDKITSNSTNIKINDKSDISKKYLSNLKFETLENDIQHIANKITDKYLLDFNDAKEVFLIVQKWLDDAKLFFTLQNHASDYVEIIEDMSQLYKYLAFFEEDDKRQAKMHKRRIDLLEGIVKELNENYYKSICQQIWIELGETYSEILDIKLDHLKTIDKRPTHHMITKINNLTNAAIESFRKFLKSITKCNNIKFSEEIMKPALCAYFHLGRLYNKFITSNKQRQLENTKKSLDAYMFLVNYCEKDLKATKLLSMELSICKDFVKILPIKINKLMQELSNN